MIDNLMRWRRTQAKIDDVLGGGELDIGGKWTHSTVGGESGRGGGSDNVAGEGKLTILSRSGD